MLLSRDEFRKAVSERDDGKCVICKNNAIDSHHIMERRLFAEEFEIGGYFVDNGASVCAKCHILCEQTTISTSDVRKAAEIKKIVLPSHLYDDREYDKWGNIILPNGQRLKGELFYDESVQKILTEVLHLFTHYVKYPRTHHVPWSPGMHKDDRMHTTANQWKGKQVVVTLKKDGENFSIYNNHCHARSISSGGHPSRTWIKNFWASIAHDIPDGFRICGENLYAVHSIKYDNLPSYFLGFSIWNDKNYCLSWDETLEWFSLLGITPVPVIYEGIYDEDLIKNIKIDTEKEEGYVLRTRDGFSYGEFRKYVAKWVRPAHVQTTKHWMHGQPVIPNGLNNVQN